MNYNENWVVDKCPYDDEMYCVKTDGGEGYIVAHNLPIEDAKLIAAAPRMGNQIKEITARTKRLQEIFVGIEHRKNLRGFYVNEDAYDLMEQVEKIFWY